LAHSSLDQHLSYVVFSWLLLPVRLPALSHVNSTKTKDTAAAQALTLPPTPTLGITHLATDALPGCGRENPRHLQTLHAAATGRHQGDPGGQASGSGAARGRGRRAAAGLRRQQTTEELRWYTGNPCTRRPVTRTRISTSARAVHGGEVEKTQMNHHLKPNLHQTYHELFPTHT